LEPTSRRLTVGPRDAALRAARTCYDRLAGIPPTPVFILPSSQQHGESQIGIVMQKAAIFWSGAAAAIRVTCFDQKLAQANN